MSAMDGGPRALLPLVYMSLVLSLLAATYYVEYNVAVTVLTYISLEVKVCCTLCFAFAMPHGAHMAPVPVPRALVP